MAARHHAQGQPALMLPAPPGLQKGPVTMQSPQPATPAKPGSAPQVSNDVRMLLPLLAGILVAKWVADAATHSLYHGLLEVACVPFLPATPTSAVSLDLLPVRPHAPCSACHAASHGAAAAGVWVLLKVASACHRLFVLQRSPCCALREEAACLLLPIVKHSLERGC